MNRDENRFLEQKVAKGAKKCAGPASLSWLPSVYLACYFAWFFRAAMAGVVVFGSCASAVAQEQVDSHSLATPSIRLWDLAVAGGIFMIPIAGMSVLAVTVAIERLFGLRRQRVLPRGLVRGLNELERRPGGFDVEEAAELCRKNPSAAANVVKAMLARAGRPLGEIEMAVNQASQREADRLYANVRWLNLAASLSTMLGLIGTIQGMMMIFHRMQITDPTADRAALLAGGIYTKLVCTFAGLSVAIPSAFFSHLFEGRIQALFREIEELVFSLLPQLQRHEGRASVSRQTAAGLDEAHGNGDAISDEPVMSRGRGLSGGVGTNQEIVRPPIES
jgi:biopolymer transport protein ExbB